MHSVLARHRAREQFMTLLVGAFAAVALALAAVGVYGVVSYSVTQRTHEIGVRLALGARPAQVRLLVLASGLAPAGIGLVAGLAGAMSLGGVLGTVTFGISPRDPAVLAGVVGVMALITLIAGWVPSRRATRVDPLESLRRREPPARTPPRERAPLGGRPRRPHGVTTCPTAVERLPGLRITDLLAIQRGEP
jgi:putative ABC transport system permease protein